MIEPNLDKVIIEALKAGPINIAVSDEKNRQEVMSIISYIAGKKGMAMERAIESMLDKVNPIEIVGSGFNVINDMGRDAVRLAIQAQDMFIIPREAVRNGILDLARYLQMCLSIPFIVPRLIVECVNRTNRKVIEMIRVEDRLQTIARALIAINVASLAITEALLGFRLSIPVTALYAEKTKGVATAIERVLRELDILTQ